MAVTTTRHGGRVVDLYVPQTILGRRIRRVVIAPCRLDHLLRWQDGDFASSIALLAELAGMTEYDLRQLTFPDVDRVMAEFLALLPAGIREDVEAGRTHVKPAMPQYDYPQEPELVPGVTQTPTNGRGAVPPEPSFDEAQAEAIAMAGDDVDEAEGFDLR